MDFVLLAGCIVLRTVATVVVPYVLYNYAMKLAKPFTVQGQTDNRSQLHR